MQAPFCYLIQKPLWKPLFLLKDSAWSRGELKTSSQEFTSTKILLCTVYALSSHLCKQSKFKTTLSNICGQQKEAGDKVTLMAYSQDILSFIPRILLWRKLSIDWLYHSNNLVAKMGHRSLEFEGEEKMGGQGLTKDSELTTFFTWMALKKEIFLLGYSSYIFSISIFTLNLLPSSFHW